MQGFVKSYFNQQRDVGHSQKIMYYFKQDELPVLTTLALEFAVFNRWFASIPGPTICNRAFAHYGTSFGRVDMNPHLSAGAVQERVHAADQRESQAHGQGLLLRHDQLDDGGCEPAAEPAGVVRHLQPVSATIAIRGICRTIRSSSRTTAITKPIAAKKSLTISIPTITCRRARFHRRGVHGDQEQSRTVGEHGAADRL